MNLAELVAVRDAVIAAQAHAVIVQGSLERDHVSRARVEIGHVEDELAAAAVLLEDAIHRARNEQRS